MKLSVKADKRNADVFARTRREFIIAAQGAVKDAAAEAVQQGRAQIAAAGFSARWQRGLQSRFLKRRRDKPARLIFHRVGFMNVFERGATISGRPLLWLPIGEGVRSPRKHRGRLVSATIGGTPFLFSPKDYESALFVGVRKVTIRKRFSLRELFKRVAAKLPEFLKRRLDQIRK